VKIESVVKMLVSVLVACFGGIAVALWTMNQALLEAKHHVQLLTDEQKIAKQKVDDGFKQVSNRAAADQKHRADLKAEIYDLRRQINKLSPRPNLNKAEKDVVNKAEKDAMKKNAPLSLSPPTSMKLVAESLGEEEKLEIGDKVPPDEQLEPVPETLVGQIPRLKGYKYLVNSSAIVIVDPADGRVSEVIEFDGELRELMLSRPRLRVIRELRVPK
jgi:hypothetical protein